MKVRKAIIPVAGLGTRFLPITKSIAKELLPIIDKPTLQYNIDECIASGIEEIILITSPLKPEIRSYFETNKELENYLKERGKNQELSKVQFDYNIHFLSQDEPLGNGHAINIARDLIDNEPVAVLFGDDLVKSDVPALKQLIDIYEKNDCNVIGLREVPKSIVNRYGIVELKNDDIISIVEKPAIEEAPSNKAVIGRYILKPEIFTELNLIKKDKYEYQLTDAIKNLLKYQNFKGCLIDGEYLDVGSKEGYVLANLKYALDREDLKDKINEYLKTL